MLATVTKMKRALALTGTILAVGGGLPACLYTDPVNSPPRVEEIRFTTAAGKGRGGAVTAEATVSDPDHDRITYQWSSADRPCARPLDRALRPATEQQTPLYMLPLGQHGIGARCVWLLITDSHGAIDVANKTLTPTNTPPVAVIEIQQPIRNDPGRYALFSAFRLSGTGSHDDDGDPLMPFKWTLRTPDKAVDVQLVPCAPTGPVDRVQCFSPGAHPGTYQVDLIVNDGIDDSRAAHQELTVDPDRPPRVTLTSPPYDASPFIVDPAQPSVFSILNVDDDGDPFPASTAPPGGVASFTWSIRHAGEGWRAIPGFETLPTLTIAPDTFVSGDQVDVRAEVKDRAADHTLSGCGDDAICPASGPQRVTWHVEYR